MSVKILIVKTSSLGDILQALCVSDYLKSYQDCSIDWLAEDKAMDIIGRYRNIDNAISFPSRSNFKTFFSWFRAVFPVLLDLRKKNYDIVFDLQGNCKSALFTLFSKAGIKVGFGRKSVREWPNLLVTKKHYESNSSDNMRLQYLSLCRSYFKDDTCFILQESKLRLTDNEKSRLLEILKIMKKHESNFMFCLGSRWSSKLPSDEVVKALLCKVTKSNSLLLFPVLDGHEAERMVKLMGAAKNYFVIVKGSLPLLQNIMSNVTAIIATDSALLHLAALEKRPVFALFGPTSASHYLPLGENNSFFQGECPFLEFSRICPKLKKCSGNCLKRVSLSALLSAFSLFLDKCSCLKK